MGEKLIIIFEGFFSSIFTVTDWLGARLSLAGTVRYGHPPKLFVAFISVMPVVSELKTIWNGPEIVSLLRFVNVMVPLKVWFARL